MNDQERLERFVARFDADLAVIVRFIERRVNDDQLAQDIAEDVFERLWRKDIGETPLGRAWLYKAASNLVGHHYRRTTNRRSAEESLQVLAVVDARGLAPADALVLREALSTLTPTARDIVVMYYLDGLSASEIAEVRGMTVSAVWTTVSRSREVLRRALASEDAADGGTPRARR